MSIEADDREKDAEQRIRAAYWKEEPPVSISHQEGRGGGSREAGEPKVRFALKQISNQPQAQLPPFARLSVNFDYSLF